MKQILGVPPATLLNTTVVGQPWQENLQLGLGVDAVTGQLRASAVKSFNVEPRKQQDPMYTYALVQSESDMQSLISGSVKAAYNLEGVTVSGSTSFLDALAVSELAVTLVAQVSVLESQYALAPKYELAVQPGKGFRDKYGDYFVAGYRAGSSIYVVYQCRFQNTEQRSKFTASLAADVPQVLSAEGSASFEKSARQSSATVSIRISAEGVSSHIPTPPPTGWTPDAIVKDLLPWFNNSMSKKPIQAYLQHYSVIDPSISAEVPIDPDVFSDLSFLYNRFWLARALFKTCPDFGRRLIDEPYHRLESDIEAYQASLAKNPEMLRKLTEQTQRLLAILREINNRHAFYTQVVAAAKTEPTANQNIDADKGVTRWGYGFQRGNMPGIEINSVSDSVWADWKIGWNEHVFRYTDSTKVIVGWDLTCNRNDGFNGDWHKASPQIIGFSAGDVYVKGDYDRAYSWSIQWHVVDAHLYPTGPWTEISVHSPEFLSATNRDASEVVALWTPERIAAARPVDRSITTSDEPTPVEKSITGGDARGRQFGGTRPSEGDTGALVGPVTSLVQNTQAYPHRTVGKLFFNFGGQPCVASAVVVHKAGILTAAHCLRFNGQEATDLIFFPAYLNGNFPFGAWHIDRTFWPNGWDQSQHPAWDVGFCTVSPDQQGHHLGDVVGWVGLAWGGVAGCWNNMGYPAQAIPGFPFNGQDPWQSLGSQVEIAVPSTIAKLDNLTAGGSGGPWFMSENPDRVNGLFSQYDSNAQRNYSPQFAEWVGQFYHYVFG